MRLTIFALSLALSACSLTPDPVKPGLPVPDAYPSPVTVADGEPAADLDWRVMFGDPRLQRLIELALRNNRDLRLAALNVEAVQAQYTIQRAARLPAVNATGGVTRQRIAADPQADPATDGRIQTQHTLDIGVSAFEIDLFGRVRSLSDAAFARYLASEEGRRAVQIALVGTVADAYFAERLAEEQLDLARRTLDDWRQSLDLARRLKAADQNSDLDVAQAEGQAATAEADLEERARTLARATNALILLVGAELPDELPPPWPLDGHAVRTRLPAGLPSDLLTRRPDIRKAEHDLVAANADIGAARAAFFPRLSLTTSLGYASPILGRLFDGEQRGWSFTPQITQPLFMGGQLRAELRLAEIRKSEAIAEYERAIQTAFREVADGLAGSATYGRQIEAQNRTVASAERRLALSTLRYRAGLEGRLELLDAQRQLYAARQTRLDLKRDEIGNAISLYKALGGGTASAAE
ncbi:efflux transporter outer membrane subunit [Rhodospirillum centenum]|uniref:RND efflux system, outer membrane lipoprotein, NodT family n=1 Tax=Rhodospirillum centenum (strain ATCC 51521 / SW) TaxID=414684 RepID=B6IXR9_RHOCS|nr:efflux transporter outer membrane subunit [Rhodospirillum centenum]ACJ01093.1 RND efflux system, outer membrane lipoprotein, NodT family [Rhodospirillum centenum SW]